MFAEGCAGGVISSGILLLGRLEGRRYPQVREYRGLWLLIAEAVPLPLKRTQLPSRKLELEMTTISSNDHVEMNPSDVGSNDR